MKEVPSWARDAALVLVRHRDVDGDRNRGFRLDVLELRVGGEQAGYAKLSWVPRERMLARYGRSAADILRGPWVRDFGGHVADSGAGTARRLRESLARVGVSCPLGPAGMAALRGHDLDTLRSWADFHVDRPMVDYVRVYRTGDEARRLDLPASRDGPRTLPRRPADWTATGLGHLLYREAARWVAGDGMRLHGSGVQSASARRAWQVLERFVPDAVTSLPREDRHGSGSRPGEVVRRMVLDGTALGDWMPDWAGSLEVRGAPGCRSAHPDEEMPSPVRAGP